jgi:Protein of unknown function (DUF2752)
VAGGAYASSAVDTAQRASEGLLGMQPGWPKRLLYVALGISPLVGALFLNVPLCPTAAVLGIPCPGCGLTRATLAAVQGHFAQALHFHPLVFFVTPIYLGVLTSLGWGYVRGGARLPSRRAGTLMTTLAIVLFVSLTGVWLARFFGAFGGPVAVERL